MTPPFSLPATDFFGIQDCSSLILQVEYQGQTRNTRILERKPLINTSYCIQHRLELKYFHFAQFLLNAHQAACLQGRLLKKSSNQKWKLILSTLVTRWFSNIAFHLLLIWLKLWLQSIQNHARHSFQAFARSHLKSLHCSIQIWADALSSGRSSIWTCCFAQDSIWNILFCSYVILLLRDRCMIKRLSEAMGAALVGNNFSPIPSNFSFT